MSETEILIIVNMIGVVIAGIGYYLMKSDMKKSDKPKIEKITHEEYERNKALYKDPDRVSSGSSGHIYPGVRYKIKREKPKG